MFRFQYDLRFVYQHDKTAKLRDNRPNFSKVLLLRAGFNPAKLLVGNTKKKVLLMSSEMCSMLVLFIF